MHSAEFNKSGHMDGLGLTLMSIVLAVTILALSWTGLFVVVSDLIEAASNFTVSAQAMSE